MTARQPNRAHQGIRGVAGRGQVGAGADDGKHPPSRRHDRAVLAAGGARVQHTVGFRTGDDVADARAARIILGGQHHRHGGPVAPLQRRRLGKVARGGGMKQLAKRAVQQRKHGLRLGIAEAAVEFDHRRTS